MPIELAYTVANADFYAPAAQARPGRVLAPANLPTDWTGTDRDIWSCWSPADAPALPQQGWKVHVSSPESRTDEVLQRAAAVFVELNTPFKHLRGTAFYDQMHGKHSHRAQSGKFIAAYPVDVPAALELMRRLSAALADVDGPYVLTDRRFGDSHCVSYRYGAFLLADRLEVDGTRTLTMQGDGGEVLDERKPYFVLPEHVTDPFLHFAPADTDAGLNGYAVTKTLRPSNAGGAYRATDRDGRTVFLKEARAHNGYTGTVDARTRLREEYDILVMLDEAAPGLAPAPYEIFDVWEHRFLAAEFRTGVDLHTWVTRNTPVIRPGAGADDYADYYARAEHLHDQITAHVERLHALGYAFVDLGPTNLLIDDDDTLLLIDFETVQPLDEPLRPVVTPGFSPRELMLIPRSEWTVTPGEVDAYALAALAQALLLPMHPVTERSPGALGHLGAALAELAPLPAQLWHRAGGPDSHGTALPEPAELRRNPLPALEDLRRRTADGLTALASTTPSGPLFPTIAQGFASNDRCVAWGTAGVLHSLRYAELPIDPAWISRLRSDSLRLRDDTAPGLLVGNAGIAWVLADLGESDAARTLLDTAGRSALLAKSATYGNGVAGVALAHLAAACRDSDPALLDRAEALLAAIPTDDGLIPLLDPHDAAGLVGGRPGIALALYYLARLTGDHQFLLVGERLLAQELRHRTAYGDDALAFHMSAKDRRRAPYLRAGSAAMVHVLNRYLLVADHLAGLHDWAEIHRQCLVTVDHPFAVFSGLFQGTAGFALALGETSLLLDRPDLHEAELHSATALFRYAIPHADGVRWFGDGGVRFSADLYSGSSGVLLALHRVLRNTPDPLFTLDRYLTGGHPALTRSGPAALSITNAAGR